MTETASAGETPAAQTPTDPLRAARMLAALGDRSIVLIGMMGAGKTSVGKRLAVRLALPFVDADHAIEEAANQTIAEIFAVHGEAYFRDGERRVIARLLRERRQVIATGGGAFMNGETREAVAAGAVSIWLKADAEVLFERVRRRSHRPLLQTDDPLGTMRRLIADRYPVYASADITVDSRDVPHEAVVEDVLTALELWLAHHPEPSA
jgi:shikimate kinase